MSEVRRIELLRKDHELAYFDCGSEALNQFLRRYAWQNQQADSSRTYVGMVDDRVAGFYTLAVGQVQYEDAPDRLTKGLARHPVPIMLLARLATDRQWQGKGLGKALPKDAMLRTLQAAEIAGIRAISVHAKDESARRFYERFDFVPSPVDALQLFLLLKDVRRMLAADA